MQIQKTELAGKFRRRFKSKVHPDLNCLKLCEWQNQVLLEITWANKPIENLSTDFISGDGQNEELYFNPDLDLAELADRFLQFDDYSFINCFGELFTESGAMQLAR